MFLAAKAKAVEKLLAGRREREAATAAQQKADAEAAKQKKIEDELAALRQKAGG
jgi:hypothetical protein